MALNQVQISGKQPMLSARSQNSARIPLSMRNKSRRERAALMLDLGATQVTKAKALSAARPLRSEFPPPAQHPTQRCIRRPSTALSQQPIATSRTRNQKRRIEITESSKIHMEALKNKLREQWYALRSMLRELAQLETDAGEEPGGSVLLSTLSCLVDDHMLGVSNSQLLTALDPALRGVVIEDTSDLSSLYVPVPGALSIMEDVIQQQWSRLGSVIVELKETSAPRAIVTLEELCSRLRLRGVDITPSKICRRLTWYASDLRQESAPRLSPVRPGKCVPRCLDPDAYRIMQDKISAVWLRMQRFFEKHTPASAGGMIDKANLEEGLQAVNVTLPAGVSLDQVFNHAEPNARGKVAYKKFLSIFVNMRRGVPPRPKREATVPRLDLKIHYPPLHEDQELLVLIREL